MNGLLISPAYMSRPGIPARQRLLRTELKMAHVLDPVQGDAQEIQEKVTLWRTEPQWDRFGGHILSTYSDQLQVLGAVYNYARPTFIFDIRRYMGALPHSLWELSLLAYQTFQDVACLIDKADAALLERCGMYGDAGTSVAELAKAMRESEAVLSV
ncbi:MAG: hypothetical protein DI628_04105 [Blastochloris viridis]|uniref:Uncharacterized protein n=1 Tax=Blastochloris viridis TaxID=1079 RepID=A0A6N4REY5_BLAVI|nr:MAG: hypothetical protein DI628_04105 [Blastochloris viridis]